MVLRGEERGGVVGRAVVAQRIELIGRTGGGRGREVGLEGGEIGGSRSVGIILVCHCWGIGVNNREEATSCLTGVDNVMYLVYYVEEKSLETRKEIRASHSEQRLLW